MTLDAFRQKQNDVTLAVEELGAIADELGATTLAERVRRDLVQKLQEDRFHLVVVGEFNHGKSSFVNALLGNEALPVGVTPTTATIHHIKFAETPETTVVFASGKRESIPFGDTRNFAVGGARTVDAVDHLEIGYPAPLLRERILLVDTPGVNDLSHQRADITYSYIPRADAVLFLLDAGQILKESERVFLQEKLLKASRDKIIFVITKWDILSQAERAEALNYAHTQLAMLVSSPRVFPISAELSLAGQPAESGMPELIAHLTQFLAEERGRIQLDNALGEGIHVASLLARGIDARRQALTMGQEELDRRIGHLEADLLGQAGTIEQRRLKVREEISSIKTAARKDLERFVDELIERLPAVIDGAKKEDLGQYLPSYLEDTFRKWAETQAKTVGAALEVLAEKTIALVRDDSDGTVSRVASALGDDVKRLDVQIDTFKYDVGVAALFAVGVGMLFVNVMVGGLLTVAAPVLALVLKDRVDAEYKKRAKEVAPDAVRAAAAKVGPKLDELIEEFAAKLDSWVATAGEELHREILEVLHGTRNARSAGAHDAAHELTRASAQDATLRATQTKLSQLRAALHVAPDPAAQAAPTVAASP
jgi:small GTP-binding protein